MKIDRIEKYILSLALILSFLGVIISKISHASFENYYVVEDGLIEWSTALGLAFGAFVCFVRVFFLRPFRTKRFLIGTIILGCLLLFGFFEEISWGQRIVGFHSPKFFSHYNTQGETNLHNLLIGEIRVNKFIVARSIAIWMTFYLLILPSMYKKIRRVKNCVDSWAMPVPKTLHTVCAILLMLGVLFIASPRKGEISEFGGVWIFLAIMIAPANKKIFSRTLLER